MCLSKGNEMSLLGTCCAPQSHRWGTCDIQAEVDPFTNETHGAWSLPWNLSESSHDVVSFLQKRPCRECSLAKKEGLWPPSRVTKWPTKIPKLAHANGSGSLLVVPFETVRMFLSPILTGSFQPPSAFSCIAPHLSCQGMRAGRKRRLLHLV